MNAARVQTYDKSQTQCSNTPQAKIYDTCRAQAYDTPRPQAYDAPQELGLKGKNSSKKLLNNEKFSTSKQNNVCETTLSAVDNDYYLGRCLCTCCRFTLICSRVFEQLDILFRGGVLE